MGTEILIGDCRTLLAAMEAQSVNCCVTSPPYFGLRDYGVDGQIGLEQTPDEYVAEMVAVLREVRRVLRDDGTLWLNLGDSYNNRTKVRTSSHQPVLNDFEDDNWAERAVRGGVRMSLSNGDLKEKDLVGIPWMVAFALRADGWYLRQDIIWHKPNPMPESVRDRCTKAHEYIFMLSKSARYYYDIEAVKEPSVKGAAGSEFHTGKTGDHQLGRSSTKPRRASGNVYAANAFLTPQSEPRGPHSNFGSPDHRNRRSVWTVSTKPFKGAHFATFPPDLIEPCVLAGCPPQGTVLDPFGGAGTAGLVASRNNRNAILIELNPEYAGMADARIVKDAPLFASVATTRPAGVTLQ